MNIAHSHQRVDMKQKTNSKPLQLDSKSGFSLPWSVLRTSQEICEVSQKFERLTKLLPACPTKINLFHHKSPIFKLCGLQQEINPIVKKRKNIIGVGELCATC